MEVAMKHQAFSIDEVRALMALAFLEGGGFAMAHTKTELTAQRLESEAEGSFGRIFPSVSS
jgi:hypothetical protein